MPIILSRFCLEDFIPTADMCINASRLFNDTRRKMYQPDRLESTIINLMLAGF